MTVALVGEINETDQTRERGVEEEKRKKSEESPANKNSSSNDSQQKKVSEWVRRLDGGRSSNNYKMLFVSLSLSPSLSIHISPLDLGRFKTRPWTGLYQATTQSHSLHPRETD